MPFFLKPKTVTSLSKACIQEKCKQARFEKPVRHPFHLARSWITRLFSAAALSSSLGQFEFITLNVNIATTAHVRQVQLVARACALSRKWDRLDKWRGDQRWVRWSGGEGGGRLRASYHWVVLLCCHGDTSARALMKWQLSRRSGLPWVTAASQSRRVRGQIVQRSPWIRAIAA